MEKDQLVEYPKDKDWENREQEILDTNPLLGLSFANIFCHSVECFFVC